MEKPVDEIACISSLVLQLVKQIGDSGDRISRIHALTTGISGQYVNHDKSDQSNQQSQHTNQVTKDDDNYNEEAALIRKLEDDRLALVMDLQRQDYMSEKLLEIISQNQDIVDTVKEYLLTKDQIRHEESVYATRKFDSYKKSVLQPTIDLLDNMLFDLFTDFHKVQALVDAIKCNTESNISKVVSDEYQSQLNEFVRQLNHIYDKIL
jgi:hypothetical protein